MTYTKQLSHYVVNFVTALVDGGLEDVVISPGSRSTPLAVTFCEHPKIKDWVIIDERSAAFFALGIAQRTGRPVALVCTSGTAAANYFPALVEAYHNRIPLIVLTTDRPQELRDIGAPQAMDQIKLYGDYVKWFKEMLLPEDSPAALQEVRRTAFLALIKSQENNAGPVHLNFPFREPLMPDFSLDGLKEVLHAADQSSDPLPDLWQGERRLDSDQLDALGEVLRGKERLLFVVGPQRDPELAQALHRLAQAWGVPILADPLSQLRSGLPESSPLITMYDAILRESEEREALKPDLILRFGAMPVSKMFLFYAEEHGDIPQLIVEDEAGYRQPTSQLARPIYAKGSSLCRDLLEAFPKAGGPDRREWLAAWQAREKIARRHLFAQDKGDLTEGKAVRSLLEVIPDETYLYIGNSMAVRDLDSFFKPMERKLTILNNRGVNGIDGINSSALGAATAGDRVSLVLGDLSFYHDLTGLLAAKHYPLNVTILLINNDGGGIFSFLPQAGEERYFEKLFGTPLGIDFAPAIEMYGGHYERAEDLEDLKAKLGASYDRPGLSVVEVRTDRAENVRWHRQVWQKINDDLKALE